MFPARLRHGDAVHHPVSGLTRRPHPNSDVNWKTVTSLGVLRNHIAADAVTAVQRHLPNVFRKKRLQTLEARARYIAGLFRSDDDHPFIWREYVEGDIQNHPEVGGYKTVSKTYSYNIPSSLSIVQMRRGVFQSDPILETLLGYYSSSGIKEDVPTEDPGPGNWPLGVLALVTAAVSHDT